MPDSAFYNTSYLCAHELRGRDYSSLAERTVGESTNTRRAQARQTPKACTARSAIRRGKRNESTRPWLSYVCHERSQSRFGETAKDNDHHDLQSTQNKSGYAVGWLVGWLSADACLRELSARTIRPLVLDLCFAFACVQPSKKKMHEIQNTEAVCLHAKNN